MFCLNFKIFILKIIGILYLLQTATNSSIGDPSWIKEHKRKFSDKQLNIQKKEKKKMIEFTATSNREKKGCVIKSKQLASYHKGSVREWLGSESFEFKSDCNTEDVKIGSKKVKPGIKVIKKQI